MFFPFTLIIPWFHSCTQTPQEETFGYKYLLEVFFLSKSGVKCFRERVSTLKLHRGDAHELSCLCNLDAFNFFLICILVVFAVAHCLLSFSTRFMRRTNLFSPNLLLVQEVNTELANLQVEEKCSSSPKVTNKHTWRAFLHSMFDSDRHNFTIKSWLRCVAEWELFFPLQSEKSTKKNWNCTESETSKNPQVEMNLTECRCVNPTCLTNKWQLALASAWFTR